MNANLAVLSEKTGKKLSVGKVVEWRGKTILHAFGKPTYQRNDLHGLGFNRDALIHAQGMGAEELYLYIPARRETYRVFIGELLTYGTPGTPDEYGGNVNLPQTDYSVLRPGTPGVTSEGKWTGMLEGLPWVPDSVTVTVRKQPRAVPNQADPIDTPEPARAELFEAS